MFRFLERLTPTTAHSSLKWLRAKIRETRGGSRFLLIGGPLLIAVAAFAPFAKNSAPSQWERFSVNAAGASAEFPGTPAPHEISDGVGGANVPRKSLLFTLPRRDLSLRLSISPLPVQAVSATETERIDAALAHFARQGFALRTREETDTPTGTIHRLELRWEAKKMTMRVRVAYTSGHVHRAMATFADGHGEDGIAERFLGSFRIEATETDTPAETGSGMTVAAMAPQPHGTKVTHTGAPTWML